MTASGPTGTVEALAPGLRAVTAPNPGPMTFTGTRSYLVGAGEVAVIDPGPDDPAHLAALLAAPGPSERVAAILVTHAHRDHSGAAPALAAATRAPVHGFGPRPPPSPLAAALAGAAPGGGEGIDAGFRPDVTLGDGAEVAGPGWRLTALHTPGHLGDHLCFAWAEGGALFTGDLVMGWAPTLISPPDGGLAAYRASLARLRRRDEAVFLPGHGPAVGDPRGRVDALLAHRAMREGQVLAALEQGPATVTALVQAIYREVDPALHPAAARNVLAHLIDLVERGMVETQGPPGPQTLFRRR